MQLRKVLFDERGFDMKIFIDAGHNFSGCDTGAQENGLKEQDITFIISNKLKTLLENDGHSVKMSRNRQEESLGNTTKESLKKRCEMSNEWGADLFLSIHANAGGGKGTETFVYSKSGKALPFAKRITDAICTHLDTVNRGVKENKSLFVLKNTSSPAILIETAFIDNKEDAEKLKRRTDDFALAIFEGVTGKAQEEETEEVKIIGELFKREILTDKKLWETKIKEDKNIFYLAQKMLDYIKRRGL